MTTHKIGDTFWWHVDPDTNVLLKVVKDDEDNICDKCYFNHHNHDPFTAIANLEPCSALHRPDHTDIHFVEVK